MMEVLTAMLFAFKVGFLGALGIVAVIAGFATAFAAAGAVFFGARKFWEFVR